MRSWGYRCAVENRSSELAGQAFTWSSRNHTPRLGEAAALELCEVLKQHLLSIELDGETLWVEMRDAPVVLR